MSLHVIEGTWEEIERHKTELLGHQLRVTIKPQAATLHARKQQRRPSALGKYAFVAGGSEEFAQEKQAEIERRHAASSKPGTISTARQ